MRLASAAQPTPLRPCLPGRALDEALDTLADVDPRKAQVVEFRLRASGARPAVPGRQIRHAMEISQQFSIETKDKSLVSR